MRSLFDLDRVQLDHLNRAITMVAALPPKQRELKLCLLRALEAERQDLIRGNPSIRCTATAGTAAA